MLFSNFSINPESISMVLFHNQDDEITDRVDNVIIAQRQRIFSYLKGDLSEFDILNDIKIPLTFRQYRFLRQPITYL